MRWFKNLKINTKVMLTVMLVTLVSLSITASLFLYVGYQNELDKTLQRLNIEADILALNIEAPVLFYDSTAAEDILAAYALDKAIVSIQVIDGNGEALASYTNAHSQNMPGEKKHIKRDIVLEEEKIGTVSLIMSTVEAKQHIRLMAISMMPLLALALFAAFVLSMFFRRAITESILSLRDLSAKVAKTRNYSLRARVDSHDEVGELSTVFNSMLETVQQRDSQLESQVRQRTYELEKLAEEFRHRAFHDALTGLPNRALLNERFNLCIEHANRVNNHFACLLLDLDDFKTVNDTKGHDFGDELIKEVAYRLKSIIRADDLVCRLGGDEFVILLADISDVDIVDKLAQKVIDAVSLDFTVKGELVKTAVSIGCAIYPTHGNDAVTLKRHADVAMYEAKYAGKNAYRLFSPAMQEEVQYRAMIQEGLLGAIDAQQVELYFQPKVISSSGQVIGCEVLARWFHPTEGLIPPMRFIPLAEETGIIVELDYYVLRQTCQCIANWQQQLPEPMPIAVNLSGRHFHNFDIVDKIAEAIEQTGIAPELLEIEITEAVLIADPQFAKQVLSNIKKLGVTISLDDFGTGYSSLNYLRALPIDCIKLDKSFVTQVDQSEQDKRLIKGIISLSRGLQLKLVAEGVETKQQLQALEVMGCEIMQGFLFLQPCPEQSFLSWLNTQPHHTRSTPSVVK